MRAARIAVLACAWLAACAQLQTAGEQSLFELNGRIAARYGEESFSGNVAWRHAERADEMLLSTPLGQGVARIVREGEAVQLTTANGREYRAPDAESLTERALGFRLPLEGMADWVRGEPAAGTPATKETYPDGKLRVLHQHDWRIEYLEYDGARPRLLQLDYPGVRLRFAISEWR